MTTDSRSERATSATETQATLPPERGHGETAASVAASPAANKLEDSKQVAESKDAHQEEADNAEPPLPQEEVPPLPAETPPTDRQDDGWAPVWDENAQAYYFFNRFTGISQWTNPRVPDEQPQPGPPGVGDLKRVPDTAPGTEDPPPRRPYGGYDPSIHGDYDPTAPYAQEAQASEEAATGAPGDSSAVYAATGAFNRFTGKWQAAALTPENFNDENKSKRQMSAFFDVDAAANSHNGKSLKAERSGKKLTKAELKAFKEKRKEKKEEKRRAWLRD
ncbi:hypothetical protein MMC30_003976 [Trapelia coarctata]|nr:hypothetical protein [Trapelia coarctata]